MCEPTTIMMGGMAATSLAIGTMSAVSKNAAGNVATAAGQQDVVNQQVYNNQQAINAEAARNLSWNATGTRQEQEVQATSQKLMDNAIRAKQAASKAEAAGADAGVEGTSVESVARQVYREQGRLDAASVKNLDTTIDSLQEDKVQAEAQRVGRTQFSPIRPAPKAPSLLDLGLDIGGAAVGAYTIYNRGTTPYRYGK